jgi:hypothetical protein
MSYNCFGINLMINQGSIYWKITPPPPGREKGGKWINNAMIINAK